MYTYDDDDDDIVQVRAELSAASGSKTVTGSSRLLFGQFIRRRAAMFWQRSLGAGGAECGIVGRGERPTAAAGLDCVRRRRQHVDGDQPRSTVHRQLRYIRGQSVW